MKRWVWIGISAAVVLAAALVGVRMPSSGDDLTVFFTATTNGNLEPCGCPVNPSGGLPRRAAYIADNTPRGNARLLIEGADFVGPPTARGLIETDYLFQAMKTVGYQVFGLGARDFAFGIEFLQRAQEHYGFTFTCANLVNAESGDYVFPQYAVVDAGQGRFFGVPFGGIRVGVISVMGKDIPPLCQPCQPSVEVTDPEKSVRAALEELRAKSDIVMVLASTNLDLMRSIAEIPGVDVVIATRTHYVPSGMDNVGMQDGTVVAFTGYEARRIGYMNLDLGTDGVDSVEGDLVTLGQDRPDDPDIARIIARYREEVAELPGDKDHSH